MGFCSLAPTGPASSIGLPKTSKTLPSVFSPTGTLIGAPVLSTAKPRFSPSLEPIAIVLTIPSPSCCWTSKTRSPSTKFRASYMFGMLSLGNPTSTTAPITCTIFPVLIYLSSLLLNSRSAAHNFRYFLCNGRLSGFIIIKL